MPLKKRPNPGHRTRRATTRALATTAKAREVTVQNPPHLLVALNTPGKQDQATAPSPQEAVRALVDRYCGPGGERVVQALAVIALGNGPSRYAFFGEHLRVAPKDRVAALTALALRRWGRPTLSVEIDPNDTGRMPVQIINVFADLSGSLPDDL